MKVDQSKAKEGQQMEKSNKDQKKAIKRRANGRKLTIGKQMESSRECHCVVDSLSCHLWVILFFG